eukprot:7709815-Ditylum_brightwellii.AAC.1
MGWSTKLFPKMKIAADEVRSSMRYIPCGYTVCTHQINQKWSHGMNASEQPRYASVEDCIFYSIIDECNNWMIMDFTIDSSTDDVEIEDVHKVLLDSIGFHMAELIKIGSYGAVNTDDPKADGFYIVKFVEFPHTLQSDVVNDKVIVAGSLVCSAHYMSPVQEKSRLYLEPESGI